MHGGGGVVTSGHPAVSAAGVEVLRAGGNAVDAAVGAFFTSFHAEPLLSSAAGGGFAVAVVDGEPAAWDFFATAPGLGGDPRPYQPPPGAFYAAEVDFGSARQTFHVGPGSVAVPGALAGLCTAQREAGRLSLPAVLEPARRACETGTPTRWMGAFAARLLAPIVRSTPEFERFFMGPHGGLVEADDLYRNADLGRFYDALVAVGSEGLWHDGPLTDLLVAEVAGRGGGLTRADLTTYAVKRRMPVTLRRDDGTMLLLAPPTSSGGMLLAYGTALLDGQPTPPQGSAREVLLLRAVMAETLHARAEVIGEQTPSVQHAERLLDPGTIASGRRRLASLLDRGVGALPPEPSSRLGSTTHVSAIDRHGNACSITVSAGECSGLVLPGHGVFLNNFLGEQDINPGGFHRLAPGARMASSMTPMVLRHPDGRLTALGSGGSNRIRTALLQVVRNLVVHRLTPEESVAADRLHYEDGTLYAEIAGRYAEAVPALARDGLSVSPFPQPSMYFGGAHLASRAPDGRVHGMGDPRRAGAAAVEEPYFDGK